MDQINILIATAEKINNYPDGLEVASLDGLRNIDGLTAGFKNSLLTISRIIENVE